MSDKHQCAICNKVKGIAGLLKLENGTFYCQYPESCVKTLVSSGKSQDTAQQMVRDFQIRNGLEPTIFDRKPKHRYDPENPHPVASQTTLILDAPPANEWKPIPPQNLLDMLPATVELEEITDKLEYVEEPPKQLPMFPPENGEIVEFAWETFSGRYKDNDFEYTAERMQFQNGWLIRWCGITMFSTTANFEKEWKGVKH